MSDILQYIIFGLPAFLIAGSVHEYMHAYSAKLLGDYTATMEGRLSLNPLAHLDPLGLIVMIFARFGWMKPVPINEYNFKNPVLGTAITALAGPLSNLAMAIIGAVIYNIINIFSLGGSLIFAFILAFMSIFVWVNISLMLFNLIPLPPLDGYRIARLFIPKNLRYNWEKLEDYSAYIILLLFLPILPLNNLLSSFLIKGVTFFVEFLIP